MREEYEAVIEATQQVKAEPSYVGAFETKKKLNRAYNEELPGLTVSRQIAW